MIIYTLGLILLGLILASRYQYSYWKRKGYPYLKTDSLLFGHLAPFMKREKSFSVCAAEIYNKSKEPFFGVYFFFRPFLVIRDPELVKETLAHSFQHFHDRGLHSNETINPVSENLFSMEGEKWKTLRKRLTPTFTVGKLKKMFPNINTVVNNMLDAVNKQLANGNNIVDVKQLAVNYTTDVTISIFFGLDVNSFIDKNHILAKVRDNLGGRGFLRNLSGAAMFLSPWVFELLLLYKINDKVHQDVVELMANAIKMREEKNIVRNDFLQLLLQLRNNGSVKSEDDIDWSAGRNMNDSDTAPTTISISQIGAQCILFLVGGLETTASAIAFCLHELSINNEIREKTIKDINETLENHNGVICYESLQDMKYLELVLQETLRKYPPLPLLNRICTKAFQIPGTKYVVEKGVPIIISILGMHRDPKYFPDPMKFDPERFREGNRAFNPNVYIPFGDGPRSCIATTQGKIWAKAALVNILTNYRIEADHLSSEVKLDNFSLGIQPKGGLPIRFVKI